MRCWHVSGCLKEAARGLVLMIRGHGMRIHEDPSRHEVDIRGIPGVRGTCQANRPTRVQLLPYYSCTTPVLLPHQVGLMLMIASIASVPNLAKFATSHSIAPAAISTPLLSSTVEYRILFNLVTTMLVVEHSSLYAGYLVKLNASCDVCRLQKTRPFDSSCFRLKSRSTGDGLHSRLYPVVFTSHLTVVRTQASHSLRTQNHSDACHWANP